MFMEYHSALHHKGNLFLMKKAFGLSIPAPCHEKWSDFTPTQRGGFCTSCSKEVIDFTQWSEQQLKDYFKKRPGNTCGRFRVQQLTDYSLSETKRPTLAALIAFVILLLSKPAEAEPPQKPATEQLVVTRQEPIKADTIVDQMIVRGIIKSAEDGSTLPGVNVLRKGTTDRVVSDADGKFEMIVGKPQVSETFIFSFIGLQTKEISISTKALHEVDVALALDVQVLGETIVVGGIVNTRWYSPRGIWWKVKNWFR
jgi:hypothetical protein